MQLESPRVSVITPVYRAQHTLKRAFDSLMMQSERRWESIVVDDGSPDSSWKVAEGFAYFDPRFTLLRQENAGAGVARNTALRHARGEYILFLDADDWLEPNALALLADACDASYLDLVHGSFRYHNNDGRPTDWVGGYAGTRALFDMLCASNVLSMPAAVLVRRAAVNAVGGFDATLRTCGDWDLWGRIARRRNDAIGRIDACVAGYRMRPRSLSHDARSLLRDAHDVLERMHAPDPRVRRADARFGIGGLPGELPLRKATFTMYPVGLAAASGDLEQIDALLDRIAFWPPLSATDAAGFFFSALCFARCCGPEELGDHWPEIAHGVAYALQSLQTRTRTDLLAERILTALDRLAGGTIGNATHLIDGPSSTSRLARIA